MFADKVLGDGAAIQPEGEIVAAPCDVKITMLYPTLHAFGLVNPDGLEILVHIGIDTVSLQGKGFKAYVQEGDSVKRGDKMIRFDSYLMNQKGMDMTTMTLFPNADAFQLDIQRSGLVKKGQSRIATYQVTVSYTHLDVYKRQVSTQVRDLPRTWTASLTVMFSLRKIGSEATFFHSLSRIQALISRSSRMESL